MGGAEKVARQHEFGKLTVRERVKAICDDESFHEIGTLAGRAEYDEDGNLVEFRPSNFVFGTAEIDGRPVLVSGDDFTVRGGSADASIPGKRVHAEGLALEMGLPHVRLVDGMGGGGSVKTIEMAGRTYIPRNCAGWEVVVNHLAVAPSVSLALGSVAGIGAARVSPPVTTRSSFARHGTDDDRRTGARPTWAGGGNVEKEELGHSSHPHHPTGRSTTRSITEQEAFDRARRFLSYLPTQRRRTAAASHRRATTPSAETRITRLDHCPARSGSVPIKMRTVLDRQGRATATLSSRSDSAGGALSSTGLARRRRMADRCFCGRRQCLRRRLDGRLMPQADPTDRPCVYLPSTSPATSKTALDSGSASKPSRSRPFASGHTYPRRPRPGYGALLLCGDPQGLRGCRRRQPANPAAHHFRYAWPSGDWGSLPIEGGIEVAYKAELAAAEDLRRSPRTPFKPTTQSRAVSPFRSAEHFEIEEIIDPRDTRPILCRWAGIVAGARRPGPQAFTYRP